jgi:hypothetical protein
MTMSIEKRSKRGFFITIYEANNVGGLITLGSQKVVMQEEKRD